MTRRQVYQLVAELRPRPGGAGALLRACTNAMRLLRRMPAARDPLATRLLDNGSWVELLGQDDALGQVYQAINAPVLEAAYRIARRDGHRFTEAQIPAATQLFTPRWVVEFLLHNTLGLRWLELHDDSRLKLPWLVSSPAGGAPACHRRACELRFLDPACGTMNFGLGAIELLEFMYREEMDHAGRRGWPAEPSVTSIDQIPRFIARYNLFGIDIDPTAIELAAATLQIKLRTSAPRGGMNLRCADALLDDIAGGFDVIATNPPYLSGRHLPRPLVQRLKAAYPAAWRDACACFIERSIDLLGEEGRAGLLAMQSFMFTGAFQPLRAALSERVAIETIAHFGGGLFDLGNPGTLQTAAVVLRRESDGQARCRQCVVALRLADRDDKRSALLSRQGLHRIQQSEMLRSPRMAWCYWLGKELRAVFARCPTLAQVAPPRQGLATTDNARFVRYWWEVEPTTRDAPRKATEGMWHPYAKGGRFRRWYEAPRHRVNWAGDGAAIKRAIVQRYPYLNGKWEWVAKNTSFYFRGGLTYSYLTSGRFSARRLEAGAIFDVAGSALFPEDPLTVLGVLNSSTAADLLGAINPTVNFQVGDLAHLPMPAGSDDELPTLVDEAIRVRRALDAFDDTTSDFTLPMPWAAAEPLWREQCEQLERVESRIDRLVARLYGLDPPERRAPDGQGSLNRSELARQWVNFALLDVLVRNPDPFVRLRPCDPALLARIRQSLAARNGSTGLEQIEQAVQGLERFLQREFFPWHVRRWGRRPVLWALGDDHRELLVLHDRATRPTMQRLLRELRGEPPDGWERCIDDGIAISLAPLRSWVRERHLRALLEKVAHDLADGRFSWSQTARRMTRRACSTRAGGASRPARRGGG